MGRRIGGRLVSIYHRLPPVKLRPHDGIWGLETHPCTTVAHGSRRNCACPLLRMRLHAGGALALVSRFDTLRCNPLIISFNGWRSLRSLGSALRALRAASQPGQPYGQRLVCCRRETPDHGAVHGARGPRQDRAMLCGSDGASAGGGRNGGTAGWRPAVPAVLAAAVGGIGGCLPGEIPPCPREARFSFVHRPGRAPPGRPRLSSAGSSRGCGSARAPAAARTRARCWGAQGARCPARGSDSRRRRPRCRPW